MTPLDSARLQHRLLRLQDALVALDPDAIRAVMEVEATSIDEPLRLAVVGRVKAGKSTLVNALVGRRVAPTDEAECTRIVTWYRYGGPERAVLHLLDGSTLPLSSVGERLLPDELPVPIERISHAEVFVQEARLREWILVDTPGLGSITAGYAAATRRAVMGTSHVDALVYVVRDRVLADDAAFLHELAASAGEGTAAVGVLSHADVFGGSPWAEVDPVAQARSFAAQHAERRREELGSVVPLAGLLAEAAATGRISDADIALLAALDGVDDDDLQDGVGLPDGVTGEAVEELVGRIGWYGVARGRAPATSGPQALLEWATRAGGRDALDHELRAHSFGRHRQLRADRRLASFERAADASSRRASLRAVIAEARIDPDLQPVRELASRQALAAAAPGSPLLPDLDRVLDALDDRSALGIPPSATPQEVARAAEARGADVHRARLFAGTTAEEVAAQTLGVSYERIAARWRASGT